MRVGSEPTRWHQVLTTMQRQEKANARAHAWSPDWLEYAKVCKAAFIYACLFLFLLALLLSLPKMGLRLKEKTCTGHHELWLQISQEKGTLVDKGSTTWQKSFIDYQA